MPGRKAKEISDTIDKINSCLEEMNRTAEEMTRLLARRKIQEVPGSAR